MATKTNTTQEQVNAATDAAKDIAAHEAVNAAQGTDNDVTLAPDPLQEDITIFLPSGYVTAETVIALPHVTTAGKERWFKRAVLTSFTDHNKRKGKKGQKEGVTITIKRYDLTYRDMLDLFDTDSA